MHGKGRLAGRESFPRFGGWQVEREGGRGYQMIRRPFAPNALGISSAPSTATSRLPVIRLAVPRVFG